MTDSEKLEFLAGQVHALVGFGLAAINTHPSLASLARHLDLAEKATLARVEASAATHDYVDGLRDVFDRLKTGLESARALRKKRNKPRR
jgi:hypothetical protein